MSDLVQILEGNTFVVSDNRGDIEASRTDPTGLFSFDTRFLSRWVLTVDGQRLSALSTDDLQYFQTRFFLVPGGGTVYVDAKLSVIRQREVADGFHEELRVLEPREQAGRAHHQDRRGQRLRRPVRGQGRAEEEGQLPRRDHRREPRARLPPRDVCAGDLDLVDRAGGDGREGPDLHGHGAAARRVETELDVGRRRERSTARRERSASASRGQRRVRRAEHGPRPAEMARRRRHRLKCDWEPLHEHIYRRSMTDLAALRFSTADDARPVAAGCRPALVHDHVRARQHLHQPAGAAVQRRARRDHAAGAGQWQGTRIDDFRDEDPGRILHELRFGEMTAFEERPHSPYYGAADATALYVVLLDEYERWTGDTRLVRELEPAARAALVLDRRLRRPAGQRLCRPTSGATRRPASRTSAGRTPGTRSPIATATCPASRARPASCRATPTTPRCAAPAWRARSGGTRPSPTGWKRRPPT